MRSAMFALVVVGAMGCGRARWGLDDGEGLGDAGRTDATGTGDGALGDGGPTDGRLVDAASGIDARPIDAPVMNNVITGGPCVSGAAGQTAYRIRFVNSGGNASVDYEVHAMPNTARFRASVPPSSFNPGFQPSFEDPFLGEGGLRLDSSCMIDIELSTQGIANISSATLSIYGRSFNTTTSGSFWWRSILGDGTTATNAVSNVAPYQWYSGNLTPQINANNGTYLLRIKAGPNSNVLVVNRVEICMQAS